MASSSRGTSYVLVLPHDILPCVTRQCASSAV
jgi:hypothetical protein